MGKFFKKIRQKCVRNASAKRQNGTDPAYIAEFGHELQRTSWDSWQRPMVGNRLL